MVIDVSVQYNGGLLPDIIILLILCDDIGSPLNTQKTFCPFSQCSHLKPFDNLRCLDAFRSVQYNGGLLPDIILLLTQCDDIGSPFNTMKNFCPYSQCSHLKPFDNSEGLDAFRFFL